VVGGTAGRLFLRETQSGSYTNLNNISQKNCRPDMVSMTKIMDHAVGTINPTLLTPENREPAMAYTGTSVNVFFWHSRQ